MIGSGQLSYYLQKFLFIPGLFWMKHQQKNDSNPYHLEKSTMENECHLGSTSCPTFHPFFFGGWNCCSHQPPHFFREIFHPRKFQFSARFPPVMAIWCCGCFQYPKSNVYTTWARWGEGETTGWDGCDIPQHPNGFPTKNKRQVVKTAIPVNFLKKQDILWGNTKKTRYLRGGGKIRISRIIKFRSSSSKKVPNWSELLDYVVKFQSLGLEIMQPMVRWFFCVSGCVKPLTITQQKLGWLSIIPWTHLIAFLCFAQPFNNCGRRRTRRRKIIKINIHIRLFVAPNLSPSLKSTGIIFLTSPFPIWFFPWFGLHSSTTSERKKCCWCSYHQHQGSSQTPSEVRM